MLNTQARHEPELNRLLRQRESTGNNGLTGNDSGHNCKNDDRRANHVRHHQKERIADSQLRFLRRHGQYHRTLTHVVQHQRWQHEEQPAELDRSTAKMPHIRIKRLGPRDGEDNRAHRNKGTKAIIVKEVKCIQWVQNIQNDERHFGKMHDTQPRKRGKVHKHDWPKPSPNLGGAARLERK